MYQQYADRTANSEGLDKQSGLGSFHLCIYRISIIYLKTYTEENALYALSPRNL